MPEKTGQESGPSRPDADPVRLELGSISGFLEHARRTEEAWRLLMESVKDFAILLIDVDGRVASWNEGATRLLGYGAGEIIGQPLARLFVPEDREKGLPDFELRTAVLRGRAGDDNWLLRKDGSRFWASGVTTPLRDPAGALMGYAKVVRDLTERRLSEESLRKANESLGEQVRARTQELEFRVKELEGFSSSVAHDLRAPLRSIHRFAEILLSEYRGKPLDDEGVKAAERILEGSRNMDALIDHLLTYSRLGDVRLDLRAVDLEAAVREAREQLEAEVQERGAALDVAASFPAVLADRSFLDQILTNLLSNALKFTAPGVKPRVRIRAERRGDSVRVVVEDNGIGIAPEHQDRIFLPFERLHGAHDYPGTGIGLAIVRKAARRMGGGVGVDSAPGRGSRFWVDLPAAAA
jgi:PAS domain S-box-containing protein